VSDEGVVTTKTLIQLGATVAVAALAAAASSAHIASAQPNEAARHSTPQPAYGWPVKPFDRQHPVRGFLDDPRIGKHGSEAFHFGIDVAAPDGTPVYAVEGGTVFIESGRAVAIKVGPSHEFGYWHIVPAVRSHEVVGRHALLGHIARGWGHVHFAERIDGRYVNPLRPGGLGPYSDPVAPTVTEISLVQHGRTVELLATAHDTTWPPVPGPWANEPVSPALVQWRVVREGSRAGEWRTAADFRDHMLDKSLFRSVYAPRTAQNHQGKAGIYCFYLDRAWQPADGSYRIEVSASDTRDNRVVASLHVAVEHGEVQR
jgi:hypothetical protein